MNVVDVEEIGAQQWIRAPYRFYDDVEAHRPHHERWLEDVIDGKPESIGGERRFLALVEDDEVYGRIAVFHAAGQARFGLFEVSPDHLDESSLLLEEALKIAREWGAEELVGPISIDSLYSTGVMTSGFEFVAPIFVDHARPEYAEVLQSFGPSDTVDLASWRWKSTWSMPAPARQIAAATRAHAGLRIRPVRRDAFQRSDAPILADLHADAYRETLGYQELDADAMAWLLRDGDALDPRCSVIVELDGEPIAAVVATPNINELGLTAAEHDRPWAKLQDRIMQAVRTPRSTRVFMFCVRQAYRGPAVGGLSTMLWDEFSRRAREAEYERAETPIVPMTDSHRANSLKSIGLRPAHSFRLFAYEVSS